MSDDRPTRGAPAPPRRAIRLLEALLGPEDAEAFVGDLVEAYGEDAERTPLRARGRFWVEALAGAVLLRSHRREIANRKESMMRTFLADLRHGARLLRRAPGFALLSTASLALAIGATTAVFSVLDPLLLRSLPYPHAERVITVWEQEQNGSPSNVGWPTYRDFAEGATTLEHAAAIGFWQPTLTEGDEPERLDGARVSWPFFQVLGVHPALGRDFAPSDDVPANNALVILSHDLWERRFGADPKIVGGTISLNGSPYTVAGVMPKGFEDVFTPTARLWRVLGYDESLSYACRTCRHLRMVARLKPGVTKAEAEADLDRLSAVMVAEHPSDYAAAGVQVVPAQAWMTEKLRPILYAVAGAVALLLLLAVANVAGLQITRMLRREGEFAVRTALGARRARLAQQLLTEGTLVAALGGAAGLVVAVVAVRILRARLPASLPRLDAIHVDFAAAGVAAGITLLLGLLVGLAPLLAWRQREALESIRSGTRIAGAGRRRLRAGLVAAEIALAVTLLQGTGLLSRTLVELLSADLGFAPSHLITMEVQSTGPRYGTDAAIYANHERMRDVVGAVPGVTSVALASQLPLHGEFDRYGIQAQDKPLANPELAPSADRYAVSGDYLATMRIPIVRGRGFSPAELRDSLPAVAIVSQALARRIWPGEDPVGKRVRLGDPNGPWREVVGIAGDVRHTALDDPVRQQIYLPERQWFSEGGMVLVARTRGDPADLAPLVRQAARSVDPTQPVLRVTTMDALVSGSVAQRSLALILFGAFAAVALLMAAAGIYGALAGAVAERTREIGVRLALGASPGGLLRGVVADAGRLALLGVAIGAAGAIGVGRLLRGLLYGVAAADPGTLAAVGAVLALVALAACLVPARRASSVDPVRALRAE